ncbi:MAG: aminopeptidase P family N-terminal domain-containing protein, partial [Pseudomonadota bacterium]
MDKPALEALLTASGGRVDAAEALRLAHAAAAAPKGRRPDAWVDLIAAAPTADQRAALAALRIQATELLEDGLDAPPPPTALRARIEAARDAMIARGYDGFLIPRSDAHQSEMVARRDQRLAWAFGFTGSAGLGVLLRERCVLFVDGRYGVQARMETDGDSVEIVVGESRSASDWLRRHAPRGTRIAYDPWLHPPAALTPLAEACEAAGARLEPAGDNPVDAAWAGRAERPIHPVRRHPDAHAGRSAEDKRRQIAATVSTDGADAVVLTDPASIAWLLNVRGGDLPFTPLPLAFAILTADARVELFTDPRKFDPVRDALGDAVAVAEWSAFGPALDRLGREGGAPRGVRVDHKSAPDWVFQRLA